MTPSAGLLATSPTGFCTASPPAVARSPGPASALPPRRLPLPQVVTLPPCWPLRGLSGRPAHCLPAAGLLAAFLRPPAAATAVRPTRLPWCPPPQAAERPPLPASTSRYELTKYRCEYLPESFAGSKALLTPPGRSHFGSRQQTLKKAYSGEQIAEQEVGNGSKHAPSATSFGDARFSIVN
ncbi:hypothetical protein U9M48_026026 [Paspalum notatum var. saurae]|uniref:Uncharacterized protein n=1 Tax=Paspalum notatum var. saurae TaxID=547442 RepID=A0AAQ3TWD7_PASNO